jgi:hypothetical protein
LSSAPRHFGSVMVQTVMATRTTFVVHTAGENPLDTSRT